MTYQRGVQTYRVWPPGVERTAKMRTQPVPVRRTKIEPGLDGLVRVLWTIPKTPPSLNVWQSQHWGAQKRTKDAWAEHMGGLMRTAGLPMNCDWVYASAQVIFRRGAHRDLTNYEATFWKIFPDVLMRLGVLADDTAEQMKTGPVALIADKKLCGYSHDPRLLGITRIGIIAKAPDDKKTDEKE